MGLQLDLFADYAARAAADAPAAASARAAQLGLFEDRTVLLTRARTALLETRCDAAIAEVAALRRRYPSDPALARETEALETWARRIAAALARPLAEQADALIDLAATAGPGAPELRAALLRRAAETAIAATGDAGLVGGVPPGAWLLEVGDLARASDSLRRAVAAVRRARCVALLADAAYLQGRTDESRRGYLEALLADPFDVDFDRVRDPHVRALPDEAQYGFELGEPLAWTAPAGLVTGVFLAPQLLPDAWQLPPVDARADAPCGAALRSARRFAELYPLAAASARAAGAERTIAARRELKRLCPVLFAELMRRLG